MKISGESKREVFSGSDHKIGTPFRIPSLDLWGLNITQNSDIKVKYRIVFSTKGDVDVYKARNVNVFHCISADVVSVDSGDIEKMYFGTLSDMERVLSASVKRANDEMTSKDSLTKAVKNKTISEADMFPKIGDKSKTGFEMDDFEADEEITAMLIEWEEFFGDKAEIATGKAKKLLVSMLDHYVDKEVIETNDYIKAKTIIQSESLSMLFLQLDLTKQVQIKQFGAIMLGVATKPILDSFNQSQKMILEINSFINNILKDVVADLSSFKLRQKEIDDIAKTKMDVEVVESSGAIFRDKRVLLKGMEQLYSEMDDEDTEEVN